MTHHTLNANLPALPGGVGVLSDRLAEVSTRIAQCSDILADYRAALADARQKGISIPKELRKEARTAIRPIALTHTVARLRLRLLLQSAGYGRAHHELS